MRIVLYALCWNEEDIIPWFLAHYERICDEIIILDHSSTDRSLELLRAHPKVTVRDINHPPVIDERDYLDLKSNAYKEQRGKADWVIVCDMDEFWLFGQNPRQRLSEYAASGFNMINAVGYDMVRDEFPIRSQYPPTAMIYDVACAGARADWFNKTVCFSPKIDINYGVGCHYCYPINPKPAPSRARLLHFKMLGLQRVRDRFKIMAGRLSKYNLANGYCRHYLADAKALEDRFLQLRQRATIVPLREIDAQSGDLSHISMLTLELTRSCGLADRHKHCPINDPSARCSGSPASNDDHIAFISSCKHHGFDGHIAFEFYCEPLDDAPRMLGLMETLRDRKIHDKFLLWTNGERLEDSEECDNILRKFSRVVISNHTPSRTDLYKKLVGRHAHVRITESGHDDRGLLYEQAPATGLPCFRPTLVELPVDYWGRVHLCCADFRAQESIGNIRTHEVHDEIIASFCRAAELARAGILRTCRQCSRLRVSPIITNPSWTLR